MSKTVIFDFDDTIIAGDSILFWNAFLYAQKPALRFYLIFHWFALALFVLRIIKLDTLKRFQLMATSRISEAERQHLAQRFVSTELPKYIYPMMKSRIREYKKTGHRVIIASASATFYLDQIGIWLDCETWGTELIFPQSGVLKLPQYTDANFKGIQKAQRIQEEQIDEKNLIAYSDHHSDIPFLECAQHVFCVHPSTKLKEWISKNSELRHIQVLTPYRHLNKPARNKIRIKLLLCGKGSLDNRPNVAFATRAKQLTLWIDYLKQWTELGLDSSGFENLKHISHSPSKKILSPKNDFMQITHQLKGIPLLLTQELMQITHIHKDYILTDSILCENDSIAHDIYSPSYYSTWNIIKEETLEKRPFKGVQLMHFWDLEFIKNNFEQWENPFCEFLKHVLERIERLTESDFDLQSHWERDEELQIILGQHPHIKIPQLRPVLKNNLIDSFEISDEAGPTLQTLRNPLLFPQENIQKLKTYLNSIFFSLLKHDFLLFLTWGQGIELIQTQPHPQFLLRDHSQVLRLTPGLGLALFEFFQNQKELPGEVLSTLGCNAQGLLENGQFIHLLPTSPDFNITLINQFSSPTTSLIIALKFLHEALYEPQ